jgi:hypothetical protein
MFSSRIDSGRTVGMSDAAGAGMFPRAGPRAAAAATAGSGPPVSFAEPGAEVNGPDVPR